MKFFLSVLATLLSVSVADNRYGYAQPHQPPQLYCRPTNTSIYAEVCVPGIGSATESVERAVKRVVDDQFCYTSAKTVCREEPRTVEREVCTYTYEQKRENQPATTTQVTYETKSETMKVTACRPAEYGYGYGQSQHGKGKGEHQVCKEEYQTQEYRVPLVNEPLEVSVEVAAPEPRQVCQLTTIEITETVCEEQTEEKCIALAKLEDDVQSIDQTEATLGEPNCNKVTLTLPTEACSKHYGYPHH